MIEQLSVRVSGQGLHDVTAKVNAVLKQFGIDEGLCTVFIQHTSASLIIQENADPSARRDLEAWLNRLVAENDPLYTHTHEGPDDMPAHIKSAITNCSIAIPVIDGRLGLGTWQGLYVWEHRYYSGQRQLLLHIGS